MTHMRYNNMSIWESFKFQTMVIFALMLRELHTRFGRENIGFLWFIGEPIMFCLGVTVVWTATRPPYEKGLPMTAIVITGYVPLTMWRHCMGRAIAAFNANGSLMYHRQVTPLDIILGRIIIEVMGTLIAGLLISFGAVLLGYMKPPESYIMVYLGLFFQSLFSLATALILAPLSERSELIEKSLSIVGYLSLPLSGAFVMVDWVPQKYRWILMSFPSCESIEMIRDGQFGYHAHAHYNILYTIWINFVLIIIGVYLTNNIRKHVRLE